MKNEKRNQIHGTSILSAALIGLFAALMAAGAQIKIPGPIVPFTTQVFFCLMSGMLLGTCRAAAAQAVYLVLGLMGLPIFSGGGGLGYLLQPSFGFLIGFLIAAPTVGALYRFTQRGSGRLRFLLTFLSAAAGLAVIDIIGVGYYFLLQTLYFGKETAIGTTLAMLVLPYLLTDGIWCAVVAAIAPRIRRAISPYLFG